VLPFTSPIPVDLRSALACLCGQPVQCTFLTFRPATPQASIHRNHIPYRIASAGQLASFHLVDTHGCSVSARCGQVLCHAAAAPPPVHQQLHVEVTALPLGKASEGGNAVVMPAMATMFMEGVRQVVRLHPGEVAVAVANNGPFSSPSPPSQKAAAPAAGNDSREPDGDSGGDPDGGAHWSRRGPQPVMLSFAAGPQCVRAGAAFVLREGTWVATGRVLCGIDRF